MAVTPNGDFLGSGIAAADLIEKYLHRFEAGDIRGTMALIDEHTLDHRSHPNAVILALLTCLAGAAKARGLSAVPWIRFYRARLAGTDTGSLEDRMRSLGLVLPRPVIDDPGPSLS